jgi:large subunit ribosomal protein L19
MNLIDAVEARHMKKEVPDVRVGDTVRVHAKIIEGEKERIQMVEGLVIRVHGGGIRKTITVRKSSFGKGVERIFPVHSPAVDSIAVVKRSKVRKARLYYLRNLRGKAARLKDIKGSATAAAAAITATPVRKMKGERRAKDEGGGKAKTAARPKGGK